MAKILLVEDTPIAQIVTKNVLTAMGYEVTLAKNGQEAVQMADVIYVLILMDIGLPDYGTEGGVQATREIRAKGIDVPIFGLTANVDDKVQALMIAAGGNGCISKPLDEEKIRTILK